MLASEKKYGEALKKLDAIPAGEAQHVGALGLRANILFCLERFAEARAVCGKIIAGDELNLEGHLLMGLIARAGKDEEEALKRFKDAVYIRPSCWLAHYYMAELYHRRNEPGPAAREYEVAAGILGKGGYGEHGLSHFSLSASPDEIRLLCERNVSGLRGSTAGGRRHGL